MDITHLKKSIFDFNRFSHLDIILHLKDLEDQLEKTIDQLIVVSMKCVLCNYENNQPNDLKEHYLKNHNVDENNVFFKKLINQNKNM